MTISYSGSVGYAESDSARSGHSPQAWTVIRTARYRRSIIRPRFREDPHASAQAAHPRIPDSAERFRRFQSGIGRLQYGRPAVGPRICCWTQWIDGWLSALEATMAITDDEREGRALRATNAKPRASRRTTSRKRGCPCLPPHSPPNGHQVGSVLFGDDRSWRRCAVQHY